MYVQVRITHTHTHTREHTYTDRVHCGADDACKIGGSFACHGPSRSPAFCLLCWHHVASFAKKKAVAYFAACKKVGCVRRHPAMPKHKSKSTNINKNGCAQNGILKVVAFALIN